MRVSRTGSLMLLLGLAACSGAPSPADPLEAGSVDAGSVDPCRLLDDGEAQTLLGEHLDAAQAEFDARARNVKASCRWIPQSESSSYLRLDWTREADFGVYTDAWIDHLEDRLFSTVPGWTSERVPELDDARGVWSGRDAFTLTLHPDRYNRLSVTVAIRNDTNQRELAVEVAHVILPRL